MPKDKLDIFHISLFVSRIKPQGAENSKENRKKTNFLLGAGAGAGVGAGAEFLKRSEPEPEPEPTKKETGSTPLYFCLFPCKF